MQQVEVKVPEVGESITEGTLVQWFRQDGDFVEVEDPLFELETDKITLTVAAEARGKLSILVPGGERVSVGQVVARIDTTAVRPEGPDVRAVPPPVLEAAPPFEVPRVPRPVPAPSVSLLTQDRQAASPPEPRLQVPQTEGPPLSPPAGMAQARDKISSRAGGPQILSPAVRRMVEEFSLDPGSIRASGKDGRLTKEDVLRHLQSRAAPAGPQAETLPAPGPKEEEEPAPAPAPPPEDAAKAAPRQTRRPMSPLRQRIAERLVMAQQTAAILTTFNEADMTNVLAWREKHKQAFKEKYGISLGLMSFFVKASVDALKTVPQLNAQIQGDEIVENHYYDIGVAISSDRGLVVPVVRDADRLSFGEIELAIAQLQKKVQSKTLSLADLSGGVFTISNGGVFGSLLSTPILNPPQSGILGMHAIKKRAVVVNDQVVVRPMMYLALSYDHRIVDGREAVTFLRRIVQCIEDPERMLLEV